MKPFKEKWYNPRYSSILLNFGINKHGCSKKCPFCVWSQTELGKEYSVPTDEDIISFLSYSRRETIVLSGGGDPLWNFNENKDKLLHIIDLLHKNHRKVEIITRDYQQLKEHCNKELIIVDSYSFSVSRENDSLLDTIKAMKNKNIRLSMVYNGEDLETIKRVINYYTPYCQSFCLKENYSKPFTENEIKKINNFLKENCDKEKVRLSITYYDNLVLFQDMITTTKGIDDLFEQYQ